MKIYLILIIILQAISIILFGISLEKQRTLICSQMPEIGTKEMADFYQDNCREVK